MCASLTLGRVAATHPLHPLTLDASDSDRRCTDLVRRAGRPRSNREPGMQYPAAGTFGAALICMENLVLPLYPWREPHQGSAYQRGQVSPGWYEGITSIVSMGDVPVNGLRPSLAGRVCLTRAIIWNFLRRRSKHARPVRTRP